MIEFCSLLIHNRNSFNGKLLHFYLIYFLFHFHTFCHNACDLGRIKMLSRNFHLNGKIKYEFHEIISEHEGQIK